MQTDTHSVDKLASQRGEKGVGHGFSIQRLIPISMSILLSGRKREGQGLRVKKANIQKYVSRIVANTGRETSKALCKKNKSVRLLSNG